jgi:Zn-dependent M28 family amino/carboxypeptidase
VTDNVVGLLPGSDPRLAAETVIISAHHDHDGFEPCADPARPPVSLPEDPRPCPRIWRGADDNGSGTVGVVELARAFAANPQRPKRSILFVVFASEERGLLGAYYMAAHPLRPLATTRAMINFDMIGRDEAPSRQTDGVIDIPKDTTNRLNLIGALYSPDYDRVVKTANARVGLVLDDRFDHEHVLNVFFRSDQFPFVLHDIPAFWWFTGFHPDYHHPTDTVDRIDFPKMEKILQLAYLSAWRFAEDPQPPRFVANPKMQ